MNVLLPTVVIMGALLLIWAGTKVAENFASPQQRFDALLGKFHREHSDMSTQDQQDVLTLRMAAARVRRRATEAVLKSPLRYQEIVASVAKDEAVKLATRNKALSRAFVQWANSAPLGDILYPAAMAAVEATWKQKPRKQVALISEDSIAALTVLK